MQVNLIFTQITLLWDDITDSYALKPRNVTEKSVTLKETLKARKLKSKMENQEIQ